MLTRLSKKKNLPSKTLPLFLLLLVFTIAGSVQTEMSDYKPFIQAMKKVIQGVARENAHFFAGLGTSSDLIEALAENPSIIQDTAWFFNIKLTADKHIEDGTSLRIIPSGKELHSIYKMMADYGMFDKQEKVKIAYTMQHVPMTRWEIRQLPDKVQKKIIVIYRIAQSADPQKLVSVLVRNSNCILPSYNLFRIDSKEPENLDGPEKEERMESRERAQPARPQESSKAFPRESWARTYGGILNDGANSIQQTNDGGYIVAGYLGSTGKDFWILKLSSSGRIEWQKAYGGNGPDMALSIQQTSDGGYIVAGYISPHTLAERDIWVLKLDFAGNIEWQRAYGGSSVDWATSIRQTSDGGYIVAGVTQSFGAGDYDYWILKLGTTGDIEWQRSYGDSGFDRPNMIRQTSDGGYIVAGYTTSYASDIWLLKLSSNGDIEWQRAYGDEGSEWTDSIQQTSDGGYIVAGYASFFDYDTGDIWVLKLSSNGDIEWQRVYRGNSSDGAHSVQQTSDGGYIVTGFTESFGAGRRDVWVLKLTSSGNIEWEQAYGDRYDDWAHFIQQTSDGGYIIAGKTNSLLNAGGGDYLIIKLDSGGTIEKVPELIHSSAAEVFDSYTIPQDTFITPLETDISAQETLITAQYTDVTGHLLFSPPLGLTGTKFLNRSLSQSEYVNILTWTANPSNDDLNIVKYRIYLMNVEWYGICLLDEVDADIFKYLHRKNIWKEMEYMYAVIGVNDENEEGIPALVTVR